MEALCWDDAEGAGAGADAYSLQLLAMAVHSTFALAAPSPGPADAGVEPAPGPRMSGTMDTLVTLEGPRVGVPPASVHALVRDALLR
jgi:hypothetical protein